jgi:hypothetical protein
VAKDKKKANLRKQQQFSKAGKPAGANNFFETAEELANRQQGSGMGKRQQQKTNKPTPNPEGPGK